MGGFEEKLESILNNPQQMGKIAEMAKSLMGGEADKEDKSPSGPSELPFISDPAMLGRMAKLMGELGSEDEKTALLKAMEPYLSEKRRDKMDKAIKIARLARLAQLAIGEMGDKDV